MLNRWTQFLLSRAKFVLATGIVATIAAATYGLGVFDALGQGGFDDPSTDSSQELARERAVFGNKNVDVVAIFRSESLAATDPQFKADVEETLAGVPKDAVTSVLTAWDTGDPAMISTDGHAVQVLVSLAGETQNDQADSNDVVMPALERTAGDLEVDLAGPWAVYTGVNETVSEDLARAELITLPIVLILSLLIFGSLVAAAMPVMVGAISVLGALALVRILTLFGEVSVFSINVISLLGMGLAIDYALFIISRFREELAELPEDDENAARTAMRITLGTAGRTVLFSAFTVAVAMSALLVFPQNFLRSLGYGGIAAVLIGAVTALTILPAVLVLLGRRIDAGRMPWRRGKAVATDTSHGAWARLAHAVMKRPIVVMIAIVGLLLLVASPFLGVKWGSVDYRVLPPDHPAHVAAEKLNDQFGEEKSTANVLLETADETEIDSYVASASKVDKVLDVRPVETKDGVTLLRATWSGNSQTEASRGVVEDLREIPGPDGSKVLIGGLSADTVDLLSSIKTHLPWMGAIIVAAMLVLLFLAFGSIVLPIKAVVMNLLSISASFGVITWIFGGGHLEGFLDYSSTGFLDATQPIFMLAILVGLSMDYEVFLLSRVREQWDKDADSGMSPSDRNTHAVAVGVQKTGRIITSAALLLAVVIGGFSTSGIVFMKMIGVGMLVALLVDATIVRALLVPATMKLLGRWNWWAPGPLRRFWERYGIREA
ncbi:MMPL family transporter [Nocardioides marmoriginsengisoli]|uniref:MMPL family transporter n=1 Tax=Nocardioides marmoriginsengisoli TaxID=661483 RepID=A0A3N0CBI0_9ACTN|nr:MMPL family transporter [Nocardioides marmoriginsengisoli]RNL60611.1 MMPL family transporter [Nocardioides marmoriginsengisoli]